MKKLFALLLAALLAVSAPVALIAAGSEPHRDEIPITEVYIEGLHAPIVGSTPEFSSTLYVEENPQYVLVYQYWHDNTEDHDMFSEQEPFVADHQYSQGCMIAPYEGYYLADDCVYYFNGSAELVDSVTQAYFPDCRFVQSVAMDCIEREIVTGDVDEDGNITVSDALLALRCAMGLIELTEDQYTAADADGSYDVTVSDALMILRCAMGLIEL